MSTSAQRAQEAPDSDRVWHIEQNGINAIALTDRHGDLGQVFWIWFAANLAIVGVVLGAVAMSFGLSFLQGVLVAVLAPLAYALIGYFGVPGARTGAPTLTLSRATFGTQGNVLPSLVSWLNLVGWETVVLLTAAYALEGVFTAAFHAHQSSLLAVVSLVVVTLAAFSVALLGHATIVRLQTILSYLFGALTIVVFVLLVPKVHWQPLLAAKPASFFGGFLPAISIVVAGGALSWVNTASDYTRYLPANTHGRGIVLATTLGSWLPTFLLLFLGVLLSSSLPNLATSANPVALIGQALPAWMAVPYLLTAVGGMVAGDIMDVYSSGLSLMAANVPLRRTRTIFVDAALSIAASLYVLLVAQDFLGSFVAFLSLLAGVLAPWAAIFWLDMALRLRRGYSVGELYRGTQSAYGRYRWPAIGAWLAGTVVGLLATSVPPLLKGPLAVGIFANSSLGFFLGFVVSLVLYLPFAIKDRA